MMKSYKVPYQEAEAELVEKKSRFIGQIYKVSTPAEASAVLERVRKQYWDATHNVYAYVLRSGEVRFSDDGEPQGTSGKPTLEVFQKEAVFDVLCVVTRYFGGTLLGAGGLVRAYGKAAKLALDAAGVAEMQPFAELRLDCPYHLLEQVRKQYEPFEAEEENADYGASVVLNLVLPATQCEAFVAHLIDFSSGQLKPETVGEKMFAKKIG